MTATQHEQNVQRRFIDIISGRGIENASRHHKIYNRLLFYRFEEVIENAYARLKPFVDKHEWNNLITGFILHGARSPYIWQVPDEFRKYAANKIALPFAADLLWFEWIEIELMMQKPALQPDAKLRWDRPATLSPTARIKQLRYPVHQKNDDTALAKAKKGKYPLLVYLEPETNRVMFLEITPFMYKVLKRLKKGTSPKEAVKTVAAAYGEKKSDVTAIIRPVLEGFYALGILT
jgi:hypothetical protein